jgi:hypothetical protein
MFSKEIVQAIKDRAPHAFGNGDMPQGGGFRGVFAAVAKHHKAKQAGKAKGMKAGGYVKAADGCAKKGKTKGRMV